MAAMPALRLFSSAMMGEVASSYEAPPTCPTPCPCVKDHTETVLWAVHLVYEVSSLDLKFVILNFVVLPSLLHILFSEVCYSCQDIACQDIAKAGAC